MPDTRYDCLSLSERPWWDRDGGRWYVEQGVPPKKGEPNKMVRFKPTIHAICEPLLGATEYDSEDFLRRKPCGVRYPELSRRVGIYREGIELVKVFRDKYDLFALAGYRRQVTWHGGILIDLLFFNLALEFELSKEEWRRLVERMPDRSEIYAACKRRAELGPDTPIHVRFAAE